jgi:predicted PurR-regulated permease PerM
MSPRTIQNTFFVGLLILTTLAFFGLIQDFLMPLFWAVVLAILFEPVHQGWLRQTKERSSLSAVLSVLTILIIVILPLFLVGLSVSREAVALYERIAAGEIDLQQPLRRLEDAVPVLAQYLDRAGVNIAQIRENLSSAAVTASQYVASQALAIGQNTLTFTVMFFLMLYLLFFFLRDGDKLVQLIIRALPLGDVRERKLLAKFAEVSRATIKGTLVVGSVQGTLGGLAFWILGLPAPVFWGVVMTVLSLLPAVGSALVWGPAAIILIATGHVIKGIILIAVGTLLIGLVDNVLRPVLVGRDTKMPDYLVLLSTLGGLALFGISGFVIGPVIAAFFLAIWEMFMEEYENVDDPLKPGSTAIPPPAAAPPEAVLDGPSVVERRE